MRKFLFLCLTLCWIGSAVAQTSFPRKLLLEQFTGEGCGYCPYGMDCIQDYVSQYPDRFVWMAHHYGYTADEYSIPANSEIGSKMGVSSAPSTVINRTKRTVNGKSVFAFHPGYLSKGGVPVTEPDTALVSVVIRPDYDPATRLLQVAVEGQTLDTVSSYKVCVYIKESGTVGPQSDFYGSWKGWQAYRHTHTVRASLTASFGTTVVVEKGQYALPPLTYTVPKAWNDSNCTIVACVVPASSSNYTVLNCEQVPLCEGTDGGNAILHGGIAPVAVSADYPEEGTPVTDVTFSRATINTEALLTNGYITLVMNGSTMFPYAGKSCFPYISLIIPSQTTKLIPGTYTISGTGNLGTVYAGYRDDEHFQIGGSSLRYVYLNVAAGGLVSAAQWLLTSGQVVIGENGSVEITATTFNGSSFHGIYPASTPIEQVTDEQKPVKFLQNGRVFIRRGDNVYGIMGE